MIEGRHNSKDVIFNSGGNVGIGTTSPNAKLEVNGGANTRLIISNPQDVTSNNGALIVGSTTAGLFLDDNEIQSTGPLYINNNNNVNLLLNNGGGNVGVGTTSPVAKLHVAGTFLADDPNYTYDWRTNWQSGFFQSVSAANSPEASGWFWGINMGHSSNSADYRYNGQLVIKNSSTAPTMYFRSTNVNGDGTWAKVLHDQGNQAIDGGLCVNGTINATRVEITSTVPCSDYVFEADYDLRSLEEVEAFVTRNKHLPEVPSAAEFKENGYSVGEMDDLLLRKVEELTLYMIEMQKQMNEKDAAIEALQNEVKELKN